MAPLRTTHSLINHKLETLRNAFEDLPNVEAEFEGYSESERVDFAVEHRKDELDLAELEGYVIAGEMSPEQKILLSNVQRVARRNRAIAKRLIERSGLYVSE